MSKIRIQSGDTLSELALKHGTTVDALARANGIENPDLIYAGDSLRIPDRYDSGSGANYSWGDFSNSSYSGGVKVTPEMQRLAENARRVANEMNSTGMCAMGVERALERTYGWRIYGDGKDVGNALANQGWKQVNMSLEEALKIPGLVLVWQEGASPEGKIYGHTAITGGDGRTSISDYVENPTTNNGRSGLSIWMPPDAAL